jgi:hypothetical protein
VSVEIAITDSSDGNEDKQRAQGDTHFRRSLKVAPPADEAIRRDEGAHRIT